VSSNTEEGVKLRWGKTSQKEKTALNPPAGGLHLEKEENVTKAGQLRSNQQWL